MITAVDTNILIDILEPDPVYGPSSKGGLKRCLHEGTTVVCEVVWAEVAVAYAHAQEELVTLLDEIGIQFSAMSFETSLKAAECWFKFLQQGGKRRRIAADFLIGGHALIQCDRLLTRDKEFYREAFKGLEILTP